MVDLARDSADLRKLVDEYFLILQYDAIDSNTTAPGKKVLIEINGFLGYFFGKDIQQITIQPLRSLTDKYVYQRMSKFQQENSFGLIDKKDPAKILAFVLFVPGELIKSKTPRIMSWTLGYAFGTYYYEDILGKKGMEFLFEGKTGPEKPIYVN